MFDVTLLRSFLAVVEARQFTAAGVALGISQSTVSQHIRPLPLGVSVEVDAIVALRDA